MIVLSSLYSSGFSVDDLTHILKKGVCQERNVKGGQFSGVVSRLDAVPPQFSKSF
jgi:hypothetical protein